MKNQPIIYFFISSLIALSISLLITIIISLDIVKLLPNSLIWIDEIKWYIPFDFLLNGFFILFTQWNTKLKFFSLISVSNFYLLL